MIRIINDFYVDVDERNYTLVRDTGRTTMVKKKINNIETEEETIVYDTIGYYGSLQSAIRGCLARLHVDVLKNHQGNLRQAIDLINQTNKDFIKALNGQFESVEITKKEVKTNE